jgi:hypothetical protein
VFGDTSTRNQRGPPSTSFSPEESSFTPLGFGCARLATLAFAPPRPKGVKLEGRRAIYRNGFTPTGGRLFARLIGGGNGGVVWRASRLLSNLFRAHAGFQLQQGKLLLAGMVGTGTALFYSQQTHYFFEEGAAPLEVIVSRKSNRQLFGKLV